MFSVQCDYVVLRCFLHWLILGDVKCAPEHFSNDAPGGTLALWPQIMLGEIMFVRHTSTSVYRAKAVTGGTTAPTAAGDVVRNTQACLISCGCRHRARYHVLFFRGTLGLCALNSGAQ